MRRRVTRQCRVRAAGSPDDAPQVLRAVGFAGGEAGRAPSRRAPTAPACTEGALSRVQTRSESWSRRRCPKASAERPPTPLATAEDLGSAVPPLIRTGQALDSRGGRHAS